MFACDVHKIAKRKATISIIKVSQIIFNLFPTMHQYQYSNLHVKINNISYMAIYCRPYIYIYSVPVNNLQINNMLC